MQLHSVNVDFFDHRHASLYTVSKVSIYGNLRHMASSFLTFVYVKIVGTVYFSAREGHMERGLVFSGVGKKYVHSTCFPSVQ